MIGTTISHYRITEKLGEGGMGVVYKAEDTSLDRPVALKFLAAHLVSDEDVRKRFEREAKAAAALNHPNICTVYEIAEDNTRTFIAMAFLEGEGLDKKIESGPLKLKEALDIAIQTAKGLQAAHGKGIVHRDIKPANLMVTGWGAKQHVTVMDFGLAQLADRSKLTRTNETMGTVTYMSPEQTYGTELDHRTDIWSLGVVIYEMVTGQQPFKGHYDKAVMYSITNEQPEPITALRTGVPMELEWLVNKCLAKDIEERYQHTDELLLDLQGLKKKLESGKSTIMPAGPASAVVTATHAGPTQPQGQTETSSLSGPLAKYRVIEDAQATGDVIRYVAEDTELLRSVAIRILPQSSEKQIEQRQRRQQKVAPVLSALLVAFMGLSAVLWFRGSSPEASQETVRFSLTPQNLMASDEARAVISPDGRQIVFLAEEGVERMLWVRDLDRETPRRLEGTEGAQDPFWSPDSQWIGFGTDTELKRIAPGGGEPVVLCELPQTGARFSLIGASWSPDGDRIVFSSGLKLYEVASRGGAPKLLLEPDEGATFVGSPHFLPRTAGPPALIYTSGTFDGPRLGVLDLSTGERRELAPGARPVYSASGHVIYQEGVRLIVESGLWALPFSLETLTATGEPFPVPESAGRPSVSLDGTLVYADRMSSGLRRIVVRDRSGEILRAVGDAIAAATTPAVSPDSRLVAVSVEGDIWIYDLERDIRTRLTSAGDDERTPVWLSSGRELSYRSTGSGPDRLMSQIADGSAAAELLWETERGRVLGGFSWASDERYLVYNALAGSGDEQGGLWYHEVGPDGSLSEAKDFLLTPAAEERAAFSPDGRYLAYHSDESGQMEVYVRPFPPGPGKWQISTAGGLDPIWSADGNEIFYVEDSTLMAVPVATEGNFTPGPPQRLFEEILLRGGGLDRQYDVFPDGKRFVTFTPARDENSEPARIRVVQNWYEEFRNREQK